MTSTAVRGARVPPGASARRVGPVVALVTVAAGLAFVAALLGVRAMGSGAEAAPAVAARGAVAVGGTAGQAAAPPLASLAGASPAPGAVVRAAGPFDDRFVIENATIRDGRVSGDLRVTSDVSELLELEVVVGFYDRGGRLLGTGRHVHPEDGAHQHGSAGVPTEVEHFEVAVPESLRASAVAAAVGVPVLVNE